MDAVAGTTGGIVKAAIGSLQTQIAGQAGRISSEQERIDQIEQGLQERMAAADALIAALERQVGYFTTLFESMRLARESRR
jgi:flagellar capping protein FliD